MADAVQHVVNQLKAGQSENMSVAALVQAKIISLISKALAVALFIWGFFPEPYGLTMGLLILAPPLAVSLARLYPGMIRLHTAPRQRDPSTILLFILPAAVLCYRSMNDFQTIGWKVQLLLSALIGGALFIWGVLVDRSIVTKWKPLLLFLFSAWIYGFSAPVAANKLLDAGEAQTFRATVIGKRQSGRKVKSKYLKLEPWGPMTTAQSVRVPGDVWEQSRPGDVVCIRMKNGALFIPWYEVKYCSIND